MAGDVGSGGPVLLHGERLRTTIDRTPTGGGEKYHPLTPEQARSLLAPSASTLANAIGQIPESLRGPRVVFQATLLPNYLAASYFPSRLLDTLDLVAIGSRSATARYETAGSVEDDVPTKSLLVAGPPSSAQRLVQLLQTGGVARSERNAAEQFREISDLRLASVEEILGESVLPSRPRSGDVRLWEAVLHPGAASRGNDLVPIDDETFAKWTRYVASLGGEVNISYRREVGGLTFVPVSLSEGAREAAARFNPLRSLRPMPSIRPIPPGILRATTTRVQPPASVLPQSDLRIAVFDGGVDVDGGMYPTCGRVDLSTEPAPPDHIAHGSGVTGAVLYGNIGPTDVLGQPVAHVDHFRVLPNPDSTADPDAYWVLDRILETLDNADYQIVNLSLGPAISVEDAEEPNRWTSALDQVAYERDVLFVVAAGNNGEEDPLTGLDRVQVPADMANGLSVGACDRHAPDPNWARVSYSAVGPGRCGSRTQPVGVQFGGDTGAMFHAVLADGTLAETMGTSFASPLVVHSLGRLAARLGVHRASPNNCRALAVHLADRPEDPSESSGSGHGRFQPHYDEALNCEPNETLVIYEDRLARGEVVSLLLPLPMSIDQGNIELSWTLSIAAPTEPTQPMEYTQATIDLVFRPHDQRFRFTRQGQQKVVNVVEDAAQAASLYADGYVAGSVPISFSMPGGQGTEDQRREGGKWETLRHFRKTFRASSLRNPRLDLSYIAREGGLLTNDCPPIDYTLVVSMKARSGVRLYEETRAAFGVLSPLDVVLRSEARTRLSGSS